LVEVELSKDYLGLVVVPVPHELSYKLFISPLYFSSSTLFKPFFFTKRVQWYASVIDFL